MRLLTTNLPAAVAAAKRTTAAVAVCCRSPLYNAAAVAVSHACLFAASCDRKCCTAAHACDCLSSAAG